MKCSTVMWCSTSFGGQLQWIPEDFTSVPDLCVCGAPLEAIGEEPNGIELACHNGHIWRDTLEVLAKRLVGGGPSAPVPTGDDRCAACNQYLSLARREMRICRCSKCEGKKVRRS